MYIFLNFDKNNSKKKLWNLNTFNGIRSFEKKKQFKNL